MSETTTPLQNEVWTRRNFVANGVASYALAAYPVAAWAVETSAADLEVGECKVPRGTQTMPGYFAKPKKEGSYPVVIVVHEIFGVHEYIRDVCRRLAKEGYFAVAPDLFFRQGDATKIADMNKLRAEIVGKVSHPGILDDLDGLTRWLEGQKSADAKNIAITGFCWGGNVVWMYAAHNPKLKAGVAWYGRMLGEPTALQPKFPIDIAANLKVPVLGLYGEKDSGIGLDQVEKMRAALTKSTSTSKIIVYPDADHGFHADYRPTYHEKSAKEAWSALLSWFKEHRVG